MQLFFPQFQTIMNTLEMSSSSSLGYNVQFSQILIITGESLILFGYFESLVPTVKNEKFKNEKLKC